MNVPRAIPVVHLRVHTPHSHLFGASTIEELVTTARRGGIAALAMTDIGGLRDPFAFQRACDAAGIKALFGAQLGGRTLIARDAEGYANLCFLITAFHLHPGTDPAALLGAHGAGLFVLEPGTEKQVARLPVGYHDPKRRGLHRILRAVAHGRLVKGLRAEAVALADATEMRRRFSSAALQKAFEIAEACTLRFERRPPIFPDPPLPRGETAAGLLFRLATTGIRQRYRPVPPEAMRRLRHELSVIHELEFDAYFVIVQRIVAFARKAGIATAGRGSAANSLVAYALGITQVDPLRHALLFERFLNRARMHDPPDIDLDLDWRRRDEVLEHVYATYGRERVAMICTFQTLQFRAAFREVAKVFGLAPPEVDRISKRLPHSPGRDLADFPELRGFPAHREPYRTILRAARALCDFPRHISIHSGGIVIAGAALTRYLPLQRSRKGFVVTQFDMHGVERTGLVKIDLLGHRSLAVVDDAARWTGVDPKTIPEHDARAGALLRTGRTIGVFQLESPGMRNLLARMQGETQSDAMIGLSLIRPGPAGSGMKDAYIRRRRGEERCDSRVLAELLPETFGVMLYQEDVLRVVHDVAGVDLEHADQLRRALAGLRDKERVKALAKQFLEGARARGVAVEEAARIWAMAGNFVAYAYSKAHAATYARIAYEALWFKAHHPAAFFAAVLANRGGFYEGRAYLEEARRMGVSILPPDVNRSEAEETVEQGALRIGLARVRGLTSRTVDCILSERPFLSLTDFLARAAGVPRKAIENLVLTGGFDAFDGTRPEKLWRVLLRGKPADVFGSRKLLGPERTLPALKEYGPQKTLLLEQQLLGLTPGAHPLSLFENRARMAGAVASVEVPALVGREVTVAGWMTTYRRIRTRKGELMKFVTLEDRWGTVEVNFFPQTYRRCGHLLSGYGPYLVHGRVDDHLGCATLTADDVMLLEPDDPEPPK